MSGDTLAYALYALFALGGLGVFFALPQEGRWPKRAAPLLGIPALAGLLVLLGREFVPAGQHGFYFYLFAAVALYAAARVVTHPQPVYSAVYFVLVVVAVAGLMVLLAAEFLAVALIIIYAGAILVTYVFVMMLAHHGARADYDRATRAPFGAVLAGFVLTAAIAGAIGKGAATGTLTAAAPSSTAPLAGHAQLPPGNTLAVGASVLSRYVVPLEIAGVLLLVAMIGALAVAKKHLPRDLTTAAGTPDPEPLGHAGRTAPPFDPQLKEVP